jgi:deoxyribonuclease-4
MTYLFGAHTIDRGGIDKAVLRAGNGGMQALQLFTAIPKYYGDKSTIRPERIQRFRKALDHTGIKPENVLVHSAYVLNTATSDQEKWSRAAAGLKKELERSTALGVGQFCFHPGAATDGDRLGAVKRIAQAIIQALESIPGKTRILVENTAGAGLTMGRTPTKSAPSSLVFLPSSGSAPATASIPATCLQPGTISPSRQRRWPAYWTSSKPRPASRLHSFT